MDELTTLTHTPAIVRRRFNYKFQFIRSKGAVLLIVIDALMKWLQFYIIFASSLVIASVFKNNAMAILAANHIPFLFMPIIGLIADMCVGRYRMMLGSMMFSLVIWIVMVVVGTLFCVYNETHPLLFDSISLVVLGLSYIGTTGLQSIIVPFNIDQLMGASGDELSATIYWQMFTGLIPGIVITVIYDSFLVYTYTVSTSLMVLLSIGGIFLILALSILFICNHWLDTTPQFYNPIKLIFQVLNYARRNKYPRNRSALTFWENSIPSRLDLGKDKYGGPFTIEQVEDVRTFFRLFPVLISVYGFGLCSYTNNDYFESSRLEDALYTLGPFVLGGLFILIHLFILHPCCSNYIPSMLKRITVGLVFELLTILGYLIIQLNYYHALHEVPAVFPIGFKLALILPKITYAITFFLIKVPCLEFIVAQSPKSMRGLMVGLLYASIGFGILTRELIIDMVQKFIAHNNMADTQLYSNIVESVIILLVVITFLPVAKYYKLRIRENIVPINQIAEEHYERYQEQSDEHRRLLSYTDSY